ncbi:MAG: AAA family ATPase, partial [Acidimicrobiia bacterium]
MAVTCASCGTEAPSGAKFCMECGSRLALTCENCGTQLPDAAKFCLECGTPVGGAPATPQPPPSFAPTAAEDPPPVEVAEERRIITALFTDLAGFTSHTESVDPEEAGERLTLYHRLVREQIEGYDGRVEKLLGDGVFAVFGVPTAHEDDPERAVRAALRIQEGVERLNQEHPGLGLAVRVGITTGEAVVQVDRSRKDKVGIVGDVVNTASRLEGVAPVGGVVVDERTYLASNQMIDFRALPAVELKGKTEPVPIWQPTNPKGRYGVAIEDLAATPFVGRDSELRLIVDTFERVLREETTQFVTIVGEPGVGKSRLMQEFWKVVDGRSDVVWWRQGRCLPLGEGITFWALGEVVKSQAGIFDSDPPWQAQQKLRDSVRALVDDHAEADWILSRVAPLAGTDDSEVTVERGELFNAWLRYFEALAARNPLILVIEDLHWADDALVEFLEYLIDQTVDSPILLITTARPQLLRDRPTWGAGKVNAASIGLSPLGDEDTKRLLADLLPGRLMTAEAQQRLLERCGGIPLYATEFVRLIEEQGSAERIDELALPDSVQAITAARLDLLDPSDRSVLQAAAVVGKVFWSGAVGFLLPMSRDDIRSSLRRLAQRDLVRSIKKSSIEGEEEWTFSHALIRDVAYGRLSRADRAGRHEQIGRWMEATSRDRMIDVAEVLAYHFGEAIRLQSDPSEELRSRGYAALMAAGARASRLDAKRAIELYRQAADAAVTDAERGLALIEAGDCAATREELEEFGAAAEEIFIRLGDVENQARARGLTGTALWLKGETEEAERHVDDSLALIADRMESAVGAGALLHKASILWRTG